MNMRITAGTFDSVQTSMIVHVHSTSSEGATIGMHVHSTSSEGATITHDVKIGSDDYLDGI